MSKKEATLLLKVKQTGAKALKTIGQGIAKIGQLTKAAAIAGIAAVAATTKAYAEQEASVNSMNQALVQQGIFTKELSKKYQDMASSLQKTSTFGDEAILKSQGIIQSYLGQEEITEELMQATLDFAAAQGTDLVTAAGLVGKSIGSSTNGLARYGVEIDTSATATEKLAAVTSALSGKFGGQAAAAADGLGALKQMKNAFGDVLEIVGKQLAPVITFFAREITKFSENVQTNNNVIDSLSGALRGLLDAGIVVKNVFKAVSQVIGQQLGTAVGAIVQLLDGNFKQAWETVKTGATDTANIIVSAHTTAKEEMAAVDKAFADTAEAQRLKEEANLLASEERKNTILNEKRIEKQESWREANEAELEEELALLQLKNDSKLALESAAIEAELANATTREDRLKALKKKSDLLEKARDKDKVAGMTKMQKFDEFINNEKVKRTQAVLNTISSLQNSKNKEMVAIGKAAAAANIMISTFQGIGLAWGLGPILGPILAPLVAVAGAAQLAGVAGVALESGGIVNGTVGGTQATIGEGGRSEAVVPLDDEGGPGAFGSSYVFNVYGGILGSENDAREFAIVLDEELLKLRQSSESVAFDNDLT